MAFACHGGLLSCKKSPKALMYEEFQSRRVTCPTSLFRRGNPPYKNIKLLRVGRVSYPTLVIRKNEDIKISPKA